MAQFDLKVTTEGLEDALQALNGIKDGAKTALMRALNRTIQNMRTEGGKAVRQELPLKAGDVRATMSIDYAHKGDLTARLTSKGPRLPLIRFKPVPQDPQNPGPPGGVSVITRKSKGRKKVAGGFVANMSSGHKGIFTRIGKARLPILEKYGPAIPDILNEDPAQTEIEQKANAKLRERLDHEIDYLLSKAAK